MSAKPMQTWNLSATPGCRERPSFWPRPDRRCRYAARPVPPRNVLAVKVYDGDKLAAQGDDLQATADTPITRLTRRGDRIERTDIWPTAEDLGSLVLLSGGEVGTLISWWHASDHSEWRWRIELYNKRAA